MSERRVAVEINGRVYALAASPNGRFLFVGGEFSAVGSHRRHNLAAFNLVTGRLARKLPEPENPAKWPDDRVALLAHLIGDGSYLKQQPIGEVEALLDAAVFVRIHRSAIVNLERLARIEPYGKESRIAILQDGTRLAVSRSGYARLLEVMGDAGRRGL